MTWDEEERQKRIEGIFLAKQIEEMERQRQAALEEEAQKKARKELRTRTGLPDPELDELESIGFTPDTVSLLPLVPVVQVAWAGGEVTKDEREALLMLARARHIEDESAADKQLKEWLSHRPEEKVFASAGHLIAAMLSGPSAENLSADELVNYCEIIASASGGMLGIHRISSENGRCSSRSRPSSRARSRVGACTQAVWRGPTRTGERRAVSSSPACARCHQVMP